MQAEKEAYMDDSYSASVKIIPPLSRLEQQLNEKILCDLAADITSLRNIKEENEDNNEPKNQYSSQTPLIPLKMNTKLSKEFSGISQKYNNHHGFELITSLTKKLSTCEKEMKVNRDIIKTKDLIIEKQLKKIEQLKLENECLSTDQDKTYVSIFLLLF